MEISKIMMIGGSFLLFSLFVFPLWNITLEAPQYPEPLGMDIWITKIQDHNPNDIQNINLMNHYVGMKDIPIKMKEFTIFPIVISLMAVLGIIIGFVGNKKWYLGWFIVMVILGIAGMYDFYLWEYEYGNNLNPKAAIKFVSSDGILMGYQPPLFGTKTILNFIAHSYPALGAYFLISGMALTFLSFFIAKKEDRKKRLDKKK